MTKKEFKSLCYDTVYVGYNGHKIKMNAIFFDRLPNGFKYRVCCNTRNSTKKELYNILYNWIFNEVEPPYYVDYKYAATDEKRFKVPLSYHMGD